MTNKQKTIIACHITREWYQNKPYSDDVIKEKMKLQKTIYDSLLYLESVSNARTTEMSYGLRGHAL